MPCSHFYNGKKAVTLLPLKSLSVAWAAVLPCMYKLHYTNWTTDAPAGARFVGAQVHGLCLLCLAVWLRLSIDQLDASHAVGKCLGSRTTCKPSLRLCDPGDGLQC